MTPDPPTPPVAPPAEEPAAPVIPPVAPAPPVAPTPAPPVAPAPPVDDPLVVEYAENLKTQLGKFYDAKYDALNLKDRITTMKIVKETMDKNPMRSEGNSPEAPAPPIVNKVKDHVDNWASGNRTPKGNKIVTLKLFNQQ